ncbi:tRNA (cytidine(34)-2'-O)-methyltransferase [Zhongshania marina]|uniref:tRNA (cytidine(34)-2'-O)-methyltransferase n=1 Tax=Zhongshania marina TaxID=2304603 RepID=A0A2S4HHB7_9GAMM|nr:tRNA (cytidine(34)-2'-O)-methyltransferase [Marortus luteolus]POP53384.1 tRNA (uridine(34)/cytosine(34)/5-carboxymethylaminomethyluridine(34)-2'-O)-methyltransferase TrmL [Marortus luteolus]
MFHIALHEPRIAPNTGNIIRLVANNGCHLHLIEPLGFDLEEKKLRRAGLDYADLARVTRHADYESFLKEMAGRRIFALTTKGSRNYADAEFKAGDVLLFGSETAGLPQNIRDELGVEHCLKVPMIGSSRSLNLSNTVALVSYEAWRQVGFLGSS